jgi:hypothetical protein
MKFLYEPKLPAGMVYGIAENIIRQGTIHYARGDISLTAMNTMIIKELAKQLDEMLKRQLDADMLKPSDLERAEALRDVLAGCPFAEWKERIASYFAMTPREH